MGLGQFDPIIAPELLLRKWRALWRLPCRTEEAVMARGREPAVEGGGVTMPVITSLPKKDGSKLASTPVRPRPLRCSWPVACDQEAM